MRSEDGNVDVVFISLRCSGASPTTSSRSGLVSSIRTQQTKHLSLVLCFDMDLKPPDDEMKAKASSNFSLPASSSPITNSLSNPFSVTESSPALLQPPINNTGIAKVLVLDEDSEKETDVVDSLVDAGELSSNPPDAFVPFLGAWAKPLTFAPPATPPMPATPSDFDPQDIHTAVREFPRIPVQKIPVPELKDDGTLRFPWATRMNPATRNHYRAAKPTFRLNGTPQVTISQVLSLGPENRREYVIGQFHRCSLPPGGLIHAVVNRLLGRSCRIGCHTEQIHVETVSMHEVSNEVRGVETDKEPAQFSAVSDQVVVQVENSETSLGVELKALSMPANLPIHSKVTIAISSNSQSTSPPLAGIISAPAQPTIMEEISSPIMVSKTNLEVGDNSLAFTPTHDSLSHNHTEQPNVQDDEDGLMSDAMTNLNTSRGGSPIKPLQKYQDMDWNTIRIKGKQGRLGRGKTEAEMIEVIATDVSNKLNLSAPCSDFDGLVGMESKMTEMRSLLQLDSNVVRKIGILGPSGIDRLKDKKVLVVLDDVDRSVKLEAMAKETSWFGPGSRIIITTQDQKVLKASGINHIHKVNLPSDDEALQMFCMYAFDQKYPKDGFEELAWKVRDLVACFFNDEPVDIVEGCLAKCFLDVTQGIRVLVEKSLISIEEERIKMSKLLVQLGRQIVQNESVSEPGKRQFLNDASDSGEVLSDDKAGNSSVIGINLEPDDEITWTSERAFERLSNLQFLRILGKCVEPQSMNYLSQKLRVLIWRNFKITCFPSSFNPKFLVKLEMHSSKLVKFWEGIKPLNNLKWMDLSDSRKLEELPDFSTATNLHDLNLSDCERLVELPSSIGSAVNLHQLNFHNCMSLVKLPSSIGNAVNLRELNLEYCSRLVELPSSIWNIVNLKVLNLAYCSSLVELPSSDLYSLQSYHQSSTNIQELDPWIGRISRLQRLVLMGMKKLVSLPPLPDSLLDLHAEECESLERLDCTFRNPDISLYFINCYKLNQEARDLIIQSGTFAVFPAEEVPQCFTYRSSGSSVTVKLNQMPVGKSTKFKVGVICDIDEYEFGETKQEDILCRITSEGNAITFYYRPGRRVYPGHLYKYEIEVETEDVASTELVFEFEVDYANDAGEDVTWEIKGCGILQLLDIMNFSSSEDSASSSSAWDISEPIMNLSKACAEVKLGKKKSASKDKILNKIQTAKNQHLYGTRAGMDRVASIGSQTSFVCLIGNALIVGRELSDAIANEEEVACWSCSRVAETEAKMIEVIAIDVSNKLNNFAPSDSNEVRKIGILGPLGIGKTTIARYLFNQHSQDFQLSVFMDNIRRNYPAAAACSDGYSVMLDLQKQFMSQLTNEACIKVPHLGVVKDRLKDKKVLVVLDDVDQLIQLEAMAKETCWFGPGSRIIITTQNQKILKASGINHIYKSLLQKLIRSLVGRLPLGLRVMGSYFRGMSEQDWIEALPRKIMREQSDSELGNPQFLNDAIDVGEVLIDDKAGRSSVVGRDLDEKITCASERAFIRLSNLQFLRTKRDGVNLQSMNYISRKLRVLSWPMFHRTCFPSSFNPTFQAKLEMPFSKLEKLWGETKPLNLKWMELSYSNCLKELPDFSTATNLYELDLTHSSSLVKLSSSIGDAINLQNLNLSHCSDLVEIPSSIITNLKSLDFYGYSSLVEVPFNIEEVIDSIYINLSYCSSMVEVPSSTENAINLQELNLNDCSSLVEFPFSIGNAFYLQKLNMSYCASLVELPSSTGNTAN
uniref:ADP-ribosyl cyclase/cyclic ADP-ribose hydrolase n=1 Tax=Brassica oleracea TaxID=3712 RepID=A0A3P6BRB6_BRAOL|nr:unnamed protein product [Brassica oleracea]